MLHGILFHNQTIFYTFPELSPGFVLIAPFLYDAVRLLGIFNFGTFQEEVYLY